MAALMAYNAAIAKLRAAVALSKEKNRLNSVQPRAKNWRGCPPPGGKRNVENMPPDKWRAYFRFTRPEVEQLIQVWRIPSTVRGKNKIIEPALTAMCMLLTRLHYPTRLANIYNHYGWTPERVSYITSALLEYIIPQWSFTLGWDYERLTPQKLEEYAAVVLQKTEVNDFPNCIGFIDGTKNPTCRPVRESDTMFSGHKRFYGYGWQAVVAPDGIIINLYGPVEGRHHDAWLYEHSDLQSHMERHAYGFNGKPMCVYGDPGYRKLNPHLSAPYVGVNLTPAQQEFNQRMNSGRIAIEWSFGHIFNQFQFMRWKYGQRPLQTRVGQYFICSVLLYNAMICFRGGEVDKYFGMQDKRPKLEDVFHWREQSVE